MEKSLDNLNLKEKRLLEIGQELSNLKKEKNSANDERLSEINEREQKLILERENLKKENDVRPEKVEPSDDVNKEKQPLPETKTEGIEKLFSIPEVDGSFVMSREAPDIAYYKIDKDGNVYLISGRGIKRTINNADSYLNKNLWNKNNLPDSGKHNGVIIKKNPKINTATGNVIEKGEIEFVEKDGISYETKKEEMGEKFKPTTPLEQPEEKEETTLKNEEEWTDKDEEILQNLLKTIEDAKKRIDEIDEELLKYNENKDNANDQGIEEPEMPQKDKDPSSKGNDQETINKEGEEKYEKITLDDFMWSYPKNYTDRLGTFVLSDNEDKKFYITVEEISTKEVKRNLLGKIINSSEYKTIKLKKPYCEMKVIRDGISSKIYRLDNIDEALEKTNEIARSYAKETAEQLVEKNEGIQSIPLDTDYKIFMNIKNYVESLIREKMLRDIENDRKEKEFIYYMVEKSKNDLLINALKNLDGVLDLRFAGSDWNGIVWKYLRRISDNEGFFECKLSGFIKVIKNVNELQMENGIDGHSNKAMYKIIGPNNEIVADNIQGYNEATRICEEISENYKKQVEEEFSKISMNK